MYDSHRIKQENLLRRDFKIGTEVQFPLGTGSQNRVGEGHVFAESIMKPGTWFVRDRDRVIRGPFYPDQLLEI